ncbi:Protein of unknown function (DUF1759) [Popillia japonica]|uniref:Gag protein n=1 Tax=Popillia japonica TaxID=7064 RepID=A0AAW1JD11_POPJA
MLVVPGISRKADREEADDTEAQAFESNYFSAVSSAQVLIDDIKAVLKQDVMINPITSNIQGNLASITNHASTTGVKLPTMQLPKFNGKYTGWLEFRDAFDSLINKSEVLSKSQKFFYLKASLEGDVAKIISSMAGTAENYDTAWSLLCERYENKKLLAKNHFRELFELPMIKKESPHQLRAMLDTVTQHLRSLEALGLPVDEWDAIIIHLMTSKLDPVSEREWETKKRDQWIFTTI